MRAGLYYCAFTFLAGSDDFQAATRFSPSKPLNIKRTLTALIQKLYAVS